MMHYNPIDTNNPLVLASVSPRRKTILQQIGIPFESAGSMIEENIYGEARPADSACNIAIKKVESIKYDYNHRWILGADTIVVINNTIFGKPKEWVVVSYLCRQIAGTPKIGEREKIKKLHYVTLDEIYALNEKDISKSVVMGRETYRAKYGNRPYYEVPEESDES